MNFKITRYVPRVLGYVASISPEDGSWVLFVHSDGGPPNLFVNVDVQTAEGVTEQTCIPIREYEAMLDAKRAKEEAEKQAPEQA